MVKSFLLIVIILFQADIRRVLSRMGRRALASDDSSEPLIVDEICDAVESLATQRIGALIILERQSGFPIIWKGP